MSSEDLGKIEKAFKEALQMTPEERIEHEAQMISFRFLSLVERLMEQKGISKKELAAKIKTTPSYVTQVFRGNKLLNFVTIAKIQDALDFTFEIEAKEREYFPHVISKELQIAAEPRELAYESARVIIGSMYHDANQIAELNRAILSEIRSLPKYPQYGKQPAGIGRLLVPEKQISS